MARFASYGEALREARIRRGIDPHVAAKKLRIRMDILQAIEESDFASLPAKGYTKSMIAAYARMVGLNAEEMVNRYLEEAYSFEVGRVRESSRYEPRNLRRPESTSSRSRESQPSRNGRVRIADDRSYRQQRDDARELNGAGGPRGRRNGDFDTSRNASPLRPRDERAQRTTRGSQSRESSRTSRRPALPLSKLPASNKEAGQGRGLRQSRTSLPTASTHYSNLVASPKKGHQSPKLPFILAGVVVLLVLALLAVIVFGGKDETSNNDLPDVPVSGLTDTSTPADPNAETAVPTPPTFAEFGYKVPEGQSAYIEVYVNGSDSPSEAATVEGSSSKRYEVTGTLKFVTTNPGGVSITVDGETVQPVDEDESGIYVYTVDFESILADWNEEHKPKADESDSEAGSNSGEPSTNEGEDSDTASQSSGRQ